jgi:hypothetical protein
MTAALIWAAVKPWLKSANLWMLLLIAGMGVVIYVGHGRLKASRAAEAGAKVIATTATTTLRAANDIAKAAHEAEASTPLPADKAAILELCRRSASCRERGQR